MSLALRPVAPFDLARSLSFLRGFGPMVGEQSVGSSSFAKAVACGGQAVAFRVRQKGDREHPTLDVDLLTDGPLRSGVWRDALARAAAFLSTDEDLAPFYARAADDPAMAPLVAKLRGMHHVRFATPFEAACWGVINQRIQQPVARAMKAALVARAGGSVCVDGVELPAFPEPRAVEELGEAELARLLPGGRRAQAVFALARAFGAVDEAWLSRGPIDEVREWLRAIYGVGAFTSGFVLYRGLGRFDGASMVSPKLVSAASRLYGRELTARDVAHLAGEYGTWGGHWMLYVWASTFPDHLCLRSTCGGVVQYAYSPSSATLAPG